VLITVAQRDDDKWYLWRVRGAWKELSYSRPKVLLRQPVLIEQQKCRSYEYQLKIFRESFRVRIMGLLRESCARVVGDGLSYDFKLECQLGSEKVRVDV